MSELKINISQMEGKVPVTVLHLAGDIDANSHQELDAKAAEVTGGGARHILLDLSETSYMSSAGFRSLHKIYTALKAGTGDSWGLKLVKPSAEVKRLLKTMGFDSYLSVHDDLDEAVNAF